MTTVLDIAKGIEKFAPLNLKEDFDNVGLMVGSYKKEVKKVLLALDCTQEVIEEGKRLGVDLILTHHPLIFMKPSKIIEEDLQGSKIINLVKNDISLYSCHTNLDSCKAGINDEIVNFLGYGKGEIISKHKNSLDGESGLGRIVRLPEDTTLDMVIERVKERLMTPTLKVVRGGDKVKTLGIINGSGEGFIGKAMNMGADCIITGDTSYHFASDFKEQNISIIDAGHFQTEWLIYLKVMENIKKEFKEVEFFNSTTSKDPYEYV